MTAPKNDELPVMCTYEFGASTTAYMDEEEFIVMTGGFDNPAPAAETICRLVGMPPLLIVVLEFEVKSVPPELTPFPPRIITTGYESSVTEPPFRLIELK